MKLNMYLYKTKWEPKIRLFGHVALFCFFSRPSDFFIGTICWMYTTTHSTLTHKRARPYTSTSKEEIERLSS